MSTYEPVCIEDFDENDQNVAVENDEFLQFTETYEDCDQCDNDIIGKVIGDIGSWQWKWVVILSLFQVISTFNIMSISFQVSSRQLCR